MHYAYALIPFIQVVTAVHAIRTGRAWHWLWIILFFPLAGSAIYIVVEILPGWRPARPRHFVSGVLNALQPRRELMMLEEQLEISDTVSNRAALARYCLRTGDCERAADLYQQCLTGAFRDDATMLLELAWASYAARRYEAAQTSVRRLSECHPTFEPVDRALVEARILEAIGNTHDAISVYARIADKAGDEEPRCRLALLLEGVGQDDKARSIYRDIVRRSKRFSRPYRRSQREWIRVAQNGVGRLSRRPAGPAGRKAENDVNG